MRATRACCRGCCAPRWARGSPPRCGPTRAQSQTCVTRRPWSQNGLMPRSAKEQRGRALAQTTAAASKAATPHRPVAAAARRARSWLLGLRPPTLPTPAPTWYAWTDAPTAGDATRGCCPAAPATWPGAHGPPPCGRGERPRGRPASARAMPVKAFTAPWEDCSAAVDTIPCPVPPQVLLKGLPARQLALAQALVWRLSLPQELRHQGRRRRVTVRPPRFKA
jgi:hypothetical protein